MQATVRARIVGYWTKRYFAECAQPNSPLTTPVEATIISTSPREDRPPAVA